LFYILVTLLLAYWFALSQIPVPGYGYASLEPETNLGAWIDYSLLKGHLWSGSKTWDPEGLLSTLPAIGTGLLGVFTGHWLRRDGTPADKINMLFVAGGLCLLLGYFWDMVFPINKKIWTSSFVLFTGGLALLTLATLTWLIDIRGYKKWTIHFVYFGMNSMMVFVGSGILARLLGLIRWTHEEKTVSLKGFLYSGLQRTGLSPKVSSLLFALTFAFLFYLLLKWMYRKKWFWKI
jgi:predicted acyltransferase